MKKGIFRASRNGDLRALQAQITPDNVNIVDQFGFTALHHVVSKSYSVDCVKFLLSMGADPCIATNAGLTPLQSSLMRHDLNHMRALIRVGKVNPTADDTRYALYVYKIHRLMYRQVVLVDIGFPMPPEAPKELIRRANFRDVAVALIGIRLFRNFQKEHDSNIVKLIGKHVWSMRSL